ncbi:hypothetical protein [Lysinibacillus sp. K60]|uniref:hypothetical protein n=1 Tax=Lysinibacillus sp. K60 TaxID=2720027 RepID=UPI001C8BDA9E|nr:hypothetical protein [Lysinibacillus sp. K60]MBX8945849.1 hypothetical protein [Lysinibacillus sp. K60]
MQMNLKPYRALTEKEYVNLLNGYREHLITIEKWTEFRSKHSKLRLPSSKTLIDSFGNWNNVKNAFGLNRETIKRMKKAEYIEILKPHKAYIQTQWIWEEYRKQHAELKLPNLETIIRHFGSWNSMKQTMGLEVIRLTNLVALSPAEYIEKLQPYKELLKTQGVWDEHRRQHPELKLPSMQTLCGHFGSKKKLEHAFGIAKTIQQERDEYVALLLPYQRYLRTTACWNEYRQQHPDLNLPHSRTLENCFDGWTNLKLAMGFDVKRRRKNKSKKDTYMVLLQSHKDHLVTVRGWDEYRKNHPELELPSSQVLRKVFGGWNSLKLTLEVKVKSFENLGIKEYLQPHKSHLKTVRSWDDYRRLNPNLKLPSSQTLRKYYKSWTNVKDLFE